MRRRSYNKDTPTLKRLIYDDVELPEISEKEVVELQANTTYGYINYV